MFLATIRQDAMYALRTMRKTPAFAATAVVMLALGIGGTTAMFTVVHAVLLKPLGYRAPDRLAVSGGMTNVRFEEMRRAQRSFSDVGCYRSFVEAVALSGGAAPEALQQARVSANFLKILGLEPFVGRSFLPEEDAAGGAATAMISAELWRRRFAGDPHIAGRQAILGTAPYTIVGVLPPGFAFPFQGGDVWLTGPALGLRPVSPGLTAFGRLNPGVTFEHATAEAEVLHRQYAAAHPGMLDGRLNLPARVAPLKESLVTKVHAQLWMLFGAVSFVLLIACANVASLLLARSASRTREFAVRAALGAARTRLMGQMLTESVLLSLAGGSLGVALARWSLSGITRMTALGLPRLGEIRLDGAVMAFAVAISIATGVVFSLVPSLGASRPNLAGALRASGEGSNTLGSSGSILRLNARAVLVAAQLALSMVLLIGAALLMQTMLNLFRTDPGFRPDHLLTLQLSLPPTRYDTPQKNAAFFEELVDRVEAIPGVRGAAASRSLPLGGPALTPVQPSDQAPVLMNQRPFAALQEITPAYFRALAIPLRRGREFTAKDDPSVALVTIINEKLARTFWPEYPGGIDPVGRHLLIGAGQRPVEIVGIVADVHEGLGDEAWAAVYRPWAQTPLWGAAFAVRTEGDPLRMVNAIRNQVLAIDRDQPVSGVKTMEDAVEADEGQRRLILALLEAFAGVAVLLTMVGIYGIIAYSVAQRTREMGIRRALGAQRGNILWLVLREGLAMTLGGVTLGAGGAFALTRVMKALLYGVSATDPATFAGIAILLTLLALAACYVPARRAIRIDSMAALRI